MGNLVLSKTRMGAYLRCPMFYWFNYLSNLEKSTDYARLLGVCVHSFIAGLYANVKPNSGKRFFYKDIKSARSAWFYRWHIACEREKSKLKSIDPKQEKDMGVTGWICIQNYWKQNFDKPDPIAIEKRVDFPLTGGVRLLGIFDQLRRMDISVVSKFRPELVKDGKLAQAYDAVVIVDLKTNKQSFGRLFGLNADEWAAQQFELHEDIQVTMYHWLYWKMTGKLPVGFFWYHLRSGKYVFTHRTLEDFDTLYAQVRHIVNNINAESYPKNPSDKCKYCDFFKACAALRTDRPLSVSRETSDVETTGNIVVDTGIKVVEAIQKRLKLKVDRVKRIKETKVNPDQPNLIEVPDNFRVGPDLE